MSATTSSKLTLALGKCGCSLSVTFPRVHAGGMVFTMSKNFMSIDVHLCALHESAEDLRNACSKAVVALDGQPDNWSIEACELAKAALERANRKKVAPVAKKRPGHG